ncbi:MAG: aldo/keto reductase [Geobacteraceae bacterium GWC2_58_44]|nr:MAG: aldo/keto reductase [Geobacteraceae bacterium GWC2_58_44]HBG08238.1 aldo/keto reductase [Geobacter sp.]
MDIPKRQLGKTGVEVTILGLGGEGILRSRGFDREASELINRALDLGINYCESARAYDGSESYYGNTLQQRRSEIFLTSKSHARDKTGALTHLHQTLRSMNTEYLDLWQVHDVRTGDDVEEIFGAGGAIEAFVEAKEKGLVRFIGVTGHHDPAIIRACIMRFPFDTVLLPVNPAEPVHQSFIQEVIPLAQEREMGIVGMKVYLRGLARRIPGHPGMKPYLRFALSQQVSNIVIGCDDLGQVEENVALARSFSPMSPEEQEELISHVAPHARELMYYKP